MVFMDLTGGNDAIEAVLGSLASCSLQMSASVVVSINFVPAQYTGL